MKLGTRLVGQQEKEYVYYHKVPTFLTPFLEPVSTEIPEVCIPYKSSTVWVPKTFSAPIVWVACKAWESWRAAEVEERNLCRLLGECEHNWRLSTEVEGVVGGRCGKVRFGVAARVQSAFGCCPLHNLTARSALQRQPPSPLSPPRPCATRNTSPLTRYALRPEQTICQVANYTIPFRG